MIDSIYLGDKGITSTSANYLANLAKEVAKKTEAQLSNITFTNKTVELINGDKKTLRKGWMSTLQVAEMLTRISNLNAFCAWMREAIKAKENALSKISALSLTEFCNIKGIEKPVCPESPNTVTEADIYREMSVKDKNNYLRIEAFAATFGKYIHPDGAVANAREDALYHEQVPNEVKGTGRDMIIYGYTPSVAIFEIDNMFMDLQNKQREYEKQLNAIKHQVKDEVDKRNVANLQKYKAEFAAYSDEVAKINQAMNIYINNGRAEIANLKIVIPEKLQDTYEYLESLGKK